MLIVHSTNRVTPSNHARAPQTFSPYYYTPYRFEVNGKKVDFRSTVTYSFMISDGPTVTKAIGKGTMVSTPFVSWRPIVDPDYPLKENRLHDCDHRHLRGELNIVPRTLANVAKLADRQGKFVSTWSYVSQVGEVLHYDAKYPVVSLPENLTQSTNTTVTILPGQTVHAVAIRDYMKDGKNTTDVLYSDIGSRYLGSGDDLGWSTNTDKHVYALVYHQLKASYVQTTVDFVFLSHPVSLPTWSEWNRVTIQIPSFISINDDATVPYLRRLCPGPGQFEAKGAWSDPLAESPIQLLDLWCNYNPQWLDILYNRYITDDVRHTATWMVAGATQEALLAEKVLDVNSLMYIRDFFEIDKLFKSFSSLITDGINPRTISGAYLAQHYGVRLTYKDTLKIIRGVKRLVRVMKKQYDYSYGHIDSTYNGVKLRANVSIAYGLYDNTLLRFLDLLSRLDLLLTPANYWDMISYSFVVDWFFPVSSILETWEAGYRWAVAANYRACNSVEATIELAGSIFTKYTDYLTAYGNAEFVAYTRHYSATPMLPLPWLSLDELEASWNSTRFLVSSALLVQRIG